MDSKIRNFELLIVDEINKSDIPLEIKRLVLLEILDKVSKAAESEILLQIRKKEETEDAESSHS